MRAEKLLSASESPDFVLVPELDGLGAVFHSTQGRNLEWNERMVFSSPNRRRVLSRRGAQTSSG
jgi:hypothetical protein